MKIAVIYGAMPNYDGGLGQVLKIISNTLLELEVEVQDVSLAYVQMPYFDGMGAAAAEDVMRDIESSDGVIFATTSILYSMSAVMGAFMEYFALGDHEEILHDKNCMVVVCSHGSDERYVLETFSRKLNSLGAFDSVKLGLSHNLVKAIGNEDVFGIIVRLVEDFYRIVRQNRRFFLMGDGACPQEAAPIAGLSQNQYETLKQMEKRQKLDISKIYEKLNLSSMTRKQEQDVNEISQILSMKYSEPEERKPSILVQAPQMSNVLNSLNVPARTATCKQMTQSMPHYFQPQMSAGFSAVIQLNISGAEEFEGYVEIVNSECRYTDGTSAAPDITILADTSVWTDVLTGKSSAQKAFMIGKLKVRGNFVVLTKLEQLFKPM